MPATYRSIVLESPAANRPTVMSIPVRPPGPKEAAVRVNAAALNHRDVWIAKGKYADIRYPVLPGSDGAGVVDEIGADVDPRWLGQKVVINPTLSWGDDPRAPTGDWRILGMPDAGTLAERVVVPASNLAAMPGHLSFEEAAALPLAGVTAYRALFTRGGLAQTPGVREKVLITGAGGGVAQFLILFALSTGAIVYVTSRSDEKISRAVAAGAAGGANYEDDQWAKKLTASAGLFDLIVDSAGGAAIPKLCDLARPGGRLVFFGATVGDPPAMPLRKIFWRQLSLLGTTMGSPADFAGMLGLVSGQRLRPVIDTVYELANADQAFHRMESAEQYGKIVLTVAK
ncbi:MAG: zinc-binding alcohol dehydrogenase/oxidoreductase [Myxococcales bacterium]|jgi:NADPH:quinone reductase-like Zn-dependent oxidoreductase|nr:zinc-binding alcohol dehydrogenase/oxidoreductase [Myxococcales bacterium]